MAEVAIGSATRPHRCTAETASRFNNCIEDTSDDKASMDDPLKCMDDDTSTSAWPSSRKLSSDECERHRVFLRGLLLSSGHYVIVKVRPGVLVGGFGFKTCGEKDC